MQENFFKDATDTFTRQLQTSLGSGFFQSRRCICTVTLSSPPLASTPSPTSLHWLCLYPRREISCGRIFAVTLHCILSGLLLSSSHVLWLDLYYHLKIPIGWVFAVILRYPVPGILPSPSSGARWLDLYLLPQVCIVWIFSVTLRWTFAEFLLSPKVSTDWILTDLPTPILAGSIPSPPGDRTSGFP